MHGSLDLGGKAPLKVMFCLAGAPVSAAITLTDVFGGLHLQASLRCDATSVGTLTAESLALKTVLPHKPATNVVCVEVRMMPSGRRRLSLIGGDASGMRAAMLAADMVPELVPTSQTLPPSRMRSRTSWITCAMSCAYCADSRTLPSMATWLGVSTTATNRPRFTKRSCDRTRKLPDRLVPIEPSGCRLSRPLPPAKRMTAWRG